MQYVVEKTPGAIFAHGHSSATAEQIRNLAHYGVKVRTHITDAGQSKGRAQGTTSTTALAMIFHSIQAAMIEHTGYQAEQFALIHPGGAVGERLNKKAL